MELKPYDWEDSVRVAAKNFNLSEEHTLLLQKLTKIHGPVRVSRERNGIHYNFASPAGIEKDGSIELQKRHCSLNADKYVADPYKNDMVALCHKYNTRYAVSELLAMKNIDLRIPQGIKIDRRANMRDPRASLKYDEYGNPIPDNVGNIIPVNKLPPNHPAVVYLSSREGGAFSMDDLYRQFRCSFCTASNPEKRFLSMPFGFKKSPEGRIVYFIDQHGKERGWQARVIEWEHEGFLYYWNPSEQLFRPVYVLSSNIPSTLRDLDVNGEPKKWTLLPEFRQFKDFSLPKYLIATGSERNTVLLGFDGSLSLSKDTGFKGLFICEGPMDAARIFQCGYPAAACMGKYVSVNQINLAANSFDFVVGIGDNDDAGSSFMEGFKASCLQCGMRHFTLPVPNEYKDAGETPFSVMMPYLNDFLYNNNLLKP